MKKWLLALVAGLSAQSCAPAVDQVESNAKVIDVRTTQEWNTGHLEGAIHLSMDLLPSKIEALVPDKTQQVILYCRSGNRAGQMLSVMKKLGYENVINAGGVNSAAKLVNDNVIQ